MGFQEGHTKMQKAIDRRVLEKVRNGIELLKKEYGENWVDHIDLDALQLSSGSSCILGQLYDGYDNGCDALGIPHSTIEYGFCYRQGEELTIALKEEGVADEYSIFALLQDAWEYEIANILADRKREAEQMVHA